MVEKQEAKKKPVNNLRLGNFSSSVWENTGKDKSDKAFTYLSVQIQRSYKDNKTGEWNNDEKMSLRTSDLPKLILLLQKTFEEVSFKSKEEED